MILNRDQNLNKRSLADEMRSSNVNLVVFNQLTCCNNLYKDLQEWIYKIEAFQ